jgi:hypothetical protein
MNNAVRVALATATLALIARGNAAAAGLANVPNAGARIHATTSLTVLLPNALPDSIVGGGGIRLIVTSASADAYDASIVAGRTCASVTCRLGFMRGMRAPAGRPAGEAVRFEGARAYFLAASCARGCNASTLTWTSGGVRYVLGIRGASLNALRFAAASTTRY